MTDKEIVHLIQQGKTSRAFEQIYKLFPMIRKMILKNGGSRDDAKDIFQDSILVFYKISSRPGFVLSAAIGTLIYSISKNLWYKKIRDQRVRGDHIGDENDIADDTDIDQALEDFQKVKVAESILIELGDPCRSLLEKFYYEKLSMKEIAEDMGYSGEKTAKAQKYKCIERAKKMLNGKIIIFKSFLP